MKAPKAQRQRVAVPHIEIVKLRHVAVDQPWGNASDGGSAPSEQPPAYEPPTATTTTGSVRARRIRSPIRWFSAVPCIPSGVSLDQWWRSRGNSVVALVREIAWCTGYPVVDHRTDGRRTWLRGPGCTENRFRTRSRRVGIGKQTRDRFRDGRDRRVAVERPVIGPHALRAASAHDLRKGQRHPLHAMGGLDSTSVVENESDSRKASWAFVADKRCCGTEPSRCSSR